MTPTSPTRRGASAFLSLPAETRLQIYSYLVPQQRLVIDLCSTRDSSTSSSVLAEASRKWSPISNMVAQNLAIETITRENGLHLLLVSKHTAAEIMALLSAIVVRFHCPRCFDSWLKMMSYGFGVGIKWIRHVEILYDVASQPRVFGPYLNPMTPQLSRFMVREMMKQCQHIAHAYYGRLDLMDPPRETWTKGPLVGDGSVLWAVSPTYRHRPLGHNSQAVSNAYVNGGVSETPGSLNQGFLAPGTGSPALLFRAQQDANEVEDDEDGAVVRIWVIRAWFNV